MIGPIISGVSSLIGGIMGKSSADKAAQQNYEMAQQNIKVQKQFARQGIRWKVEDAKAAGIHPVYALGAPTSSFTPVSFSASADNSMGQAIASMGQDVGRAINATRTGSEREDAFQTTVKNLTLQKMGLENDLLASQISKLKAAPNPPLPDVGPLPPIPEANKQGERPPLQLGGTRIQTDPGSSNMDEISKRWGDEGLPQWAVAPYIMWRDLQRTTNNGLFNMDIRPGSFADRAIKYMDRNFGPRWFAN